jgi:hypothetical protein
VNFSYFGITFESNILWFRISPAGKKEDCEDDWILDGGRHKQEIIVFLNFGGHYGPEFEV